jgi:hypothetical protein
LQITFRVNLSNTNLLDPNIASTISTLLPGRLLGSYDLRNGELVTLYDQDALYFLNNYATTLFPFFTVVDLVTATGDARMIPVGTPTLVGTFQNQVGEELTVAGGTFSQVAKIIVDSVHTITGSNQINFSPGEDNGTFSGGLGYVASDLITLSDGTVVEVDTVTADEDQIVTHFTINSDSTTPIIVDHPTLTQTSTTGSGTGFSLTLGTANQRIEESHYKQTSSVNEGVYTVLPSNPVTTTTSASFVIDWGVKSVVMTNNGNEYSLTPSVSFTGGTGTTASATLSGDTVASVTVNAQGSGYTSTATVVIEAP